LEPALGATARVAAPVPDPRDLNAEEIRSLRRRMGDSFNAAEALPGTVPVFSGVPYLIIRGAPPAGSALYYDGVPVPWLFHLALGPAITHPALFGELELHPGVAPARYGRRTGAVVEAHGPGAPPRDNEGELMLRLLDAQALMITNTQPAVSVHGRLGYPDAMLDLIDSDASLGYWDYQLRLQHEIDARDAVTVAVFGAYDRIGDRREPQDDIEVQFHRLLLRLRHHGRTADVGASIYAGYEEGLLGRELSARSFRIGPSLYVETSPSPDTRLRLGADMEGKLADIGLGPQGDSGSPFTPPASTDSFVPDLGGGLDFETGPEDFVRNAPLAQVEERDAGGIYAELALLPGGPFEIETGVRADAWLTAGELEHSADARVLTRWRAQPKLSLHAGVGSAHQAAVSPLPIPGLSDFNLDKGLQSALQTEAGAQLQLPHELWLSATGFYHHYSHLVFMELIIDCEGNTDPTARFLLAPGGVRVLPLCQQDGLPRGDGDAYGVELLLKRDLTQRLTGWVAYTLAWAHARANDGTVFAPQFDVRHVVNLVLSWDFGGGWDSGLTLHYRSGKPAVNTFFDFSDQRFEHVHARLPAFFRSDVHIGYRWATSFGRLGVTLQFLNVTFSREATKRDCQLDADLEVVCRVDKQPAIVLPNAGFRAEF
jgi:hypothetical protein